MPKGLYIGLDLGGTNIQGGVVNADGKVLARDSTKTKAEGGAEAIIGRMTALIDELLAAAKLSMKDLDGVGVGAPGPVDDKGVIITAVNLRWNNYPLASVLSKALKVPVAVDNDVNVGTWGEFAGGAAKGYKDCFGIFVGTGIGGGLVLGGELYRGAFMTAGEIGHTVLHADGGLGRRTLENLASRTAVVNQLKALIAANAKSELVDLAGGDVNNIRSKVLAAAVKDKDPLTLEVVGEAARYVGIAIANTVTVLSLPCVVVGGGVTEALGKPWMEMVRASFEKYVFPAELRKCKILQSELGDDAGVVGAALLARKKVEG